MDQEDVNMAKRDDKRDRAGRGPDPAESRRRLVSIDAIDGFKIADGEPDVRGWEVRTLSYRDLGAVEDLLIDPDRNEVVMLEVALHGDDVRAEVPLRSVQLDRSRKVVVVDSGDVEDGTTHRVQRNVDEHDLVDTDRDSREHAVRYEGDRHDIDRSTLRNDDDVEETIVERRPLVEEVVVRRRRVEE
jgi:hypothetical protein